MRNLVLVTDLAIAGDHDVRAIQARAGNREPPTEFKVFPYGRIRTTKGEFNFTPEACDILLAERAEHDADVQIDYDHLAIKSEKPGDGRAAGWCKLEKRADGLWAVDVRWTPAAAQMLRDAEYRYFSPFFGATKDDGTIVQLMNIAVTNLPAMQDIQALVAASQQDDEEVQAGISGTGHATSAVACVIKHEGGKFVLYESNGKKKIPGGTHDSLEDAQKHESAINISKARKAGHKIPQPASQTQRSTMAEQHGQMIKLKDALARHLKDKGMSMKALAEACGIGEERMRALHDGEAPTPEEMKSVIKGTGMKSEEIEECKASSFDNADPDDDKSPEEKAAEKRVATSRNSGRSRRGGEDDLIYGDLVEMTGSTDPEKHREALRSMFSLAKEAPAMSRQLKEITAKSEATRRENLIEQGKREGKLTPPMIRFWAARTCDEFEAFLKAAPVLSTASLNLQEGTPSAVAAVLSPEELNVCTLTRFNAETLAKHKVDMANGKCAQAIVDSYYEEPK